MKKEIAKKLALGIALHCVRNTSIENLHAGIVPHSIIGDNSDISLLTACGEIPWDKISRINDSEMETFLIEVVNRIFTVLINLEDTKFIERFESLTQRSTIGWNEPVYLENFLVNRTYNPSNK